MLSPERERDDALRCHAAELAVTLAASEEGSPSRVCDYARALYGFLTEGDKPAPAAPVAAA
jgi:hypothetical protein